MQELGTGGKGEGGDTGGGSGSGEVYQLANALSMKPCGAGSVICFLSVSCFISPSCITRFQFPQIPVWDCEFLQRSQSGNRLVWVGRVLQGCLGRLSPCPALPCPVLTESPGQHQPRSQGSFLPIPLDFLILGGFWSVWVSRHFLRRKPEKLM